MYLEMSTANKQVNEKKEREEEKKNGEEKDQEN